MIEICCVCSWLLGLILLIETILQHGKIIELREKNNIYYEKNKCLEKENDNLFKCLNKLINNNENISND